MTVLSRRAMLGALPAATALPVALMAQDSETPVLKLFREHQALFAACSVYQSPYADAKQNDADYRCRFFDPMDALERQMFALPSSCPADFAAKLCAVTNFGDLAISDVCCPELWAEARQLLGRAGH